MSNAIDDAENPAKPIVEADREADVGKCPFISQNPTKPRGWDPQSRLVA